MMERRFGELRSLLAQQPSTTVWEQLRALVEQMADEDAARFEAEVSPYAQEALRGWPDTLRVPAQGWLDEAATSGDHPCLPLVRWLASGPSFKLNQATGKRLAHAPGLAHVRVLHLNAVPHMSQTMLRGAPMARSIQTLVLGDLKITETSLRALQQMDALRSVVAGGSDDALISALARWGRLPTLEMLQISAAMLTAADMAPLTQCGALRQLALWSNGAIKDAGVEALCAPGALRDAPLEHLNLGGCGLTHTSVDRLARMPWRLKRLLIWDNALTPETLKLLAEAPAFAALELLNISGTKLSGDALAPLSAAPRRQLKELWVSRIQGLTAQSWSEAGGLLRGLTTLHAETTQPSDHALAALMAALAGGQIEELYLSSNALGPSQMAMLADSQLPALRSLQLSHNPITEEGLDALLSAPWADQLEVLNVHQCRLNASSIQIIRRHAPRLKALRRLIISLALPPGPSLDEQLRDALPDVVFSAHP